jgi:hypothetical protein
LIFKYYFDELRANRAQSMEMERLQHEIDDTKRAFYRSKQHLALLKEHIKNLGTGVDKQRKPSGSKRVSKPKSKSRDKAPPVPVNASVEETDTVQKKAAPAPVKPSVEEADKVSRENIAVIKDLTVKPEETRLTVNFKLIKVGRDMEPLRGYVYIIAINKEVDPPQLWPYPKTMLQNGIPMDYKQGQRFSIKHYKTIRVEYSFDSKPVSPSSLIVIVYNESGELILEKEFDVKGSI